MDMKTLANRVRTRLRNLVVSDLKIKKLIPQSIRHRMADRVISTLESRTEPPKPYTPGVFPKGVNLYGFFKAENGLAQGAKLYARALEEGGIPHTLLNTDFLDWLPQPVTDYDDRLVKNNRYAVNVVHINPDQWQEAVGMFPRSQFDGHYNIGVWLWELETIPRRWIPLLDYVDELWAPSAFIAEAVRKETDKPVTVIPYCMETPYDETLTRADFGLRDGDFLVLMVYDSNSYSSRKNPGAAIEAFRAAFGDRPEGAKLVIKISNPKPEDTAFVESRLDRSAYVLMTERLDRMKMNSLVRLCDVFLSLHRSEGFGLVLAEAMSLGTPTVATNWSANPEFMPADAACLTGYTLVPVGDRYQYEQEDLVWAEADTAQAAAYLKRLKEDPAYREAISRNGRKAAAELLSPEKTAERMAARLDEIIPGEA